MDDINVDYSSILDQARGAKCKCHIFAVFINSFLSYKFYDQKINNNPMVQEDRLRRWSEDVVDHRLRDSVRLAKLYREGIVSRI